MVNESHNIEQADTGGQHWGQAGDENQNVGHDSTEGQYVGQAKIENKCVRETDRVRVQYSVVNAARV